MYFLIPKTRSSLPFSYDMTNLLKLRPLHSLILYIYKRMCVYKLKKKKQPEDVLLSGDFLLGKFLIELPSHGLCSSSLVLSGLTSVDHRTAAPSSWKMTFFSTLSPIHSHKRRQGIYIYLYRNLFITYTLRFSSNLS